MLQIDNLYIIVAEYSKEINAMLQHAITKMVIRAEIIDLPQKKKKKQSVLIFLPT